MGKLEQSGSFSKTGEVSDNTGYIKPERQNPASDSSDWAGNIVAMPDPYGLSEVLSPGLRSDVPAELAIVIANDYGEEDREALADAATDAALADIPEQYRGGPIGRNIARAAARLALGLQPLPTVPEEVPHV